VYYVLAPSEFGLLPPLLLVQMPINKFTADDTACYSTADHNQHDNERP
jgi:hypothetical protein